MSRRVVAIAVRGQSQAIYSPPTQATAPTSRQAAFQETPAEDGARFRAYQLNHLDAATAQQRLSQFFANSPGTEVVADAPRNRVLVRGDEAVLRQAGELLAKLDPPAPPPTAAAPLPEVKPPTQQLEAYPLTPASQTILSALEKQAAGRQDIRVAVDQRTSQVLVLAPDTVHTQIRQKLAQVAALQAAPPAAATVAQIRRRLLRRPLPTLHCSCTTSAPTICECGSNDC